MELIPLEDDFEFKLAAITILKNSVSLTIYLLLDGGEEMDFMPFSMPFSVK